MHEAATQKPEWAWLVLIGGAIFFFTAFPGIFITLFMGFRQGGASFFTILYLTIALCIVITVGWGMKRAYFAIKVYKETKQLPVSEQVATEAVWEQAKRPIWPWLVIIPGAFAVLSMGPGVIMLPIAPIFLAAMSTDSGSVPDYVPIAIFTVGYSLLFGYVTLLVFAIRALRIK